MNKYVQVASVVALAVASASASAWWGAAPCVTADQQKAMVEQQQAAAQQHQAQFQAMTEQRAKAMEEMMKARQAAAQQAPGFAPMDPFNGQARHGPFQRPGPPDAPVPGHARASAVRRNAADARLPGHA